jgi:hypothetical protein
MNDDEPVGKNKRTEVSWGSELRRQWEYIEQERRQSEAHCNDEVQASEGEPDQQEAETGSESSDAREPLVEECRERIRGGRSSGLDGCTQGTLYRDRGETEYGLVQPTPDSVVEEGRKVGVDRYWDAFQGRWVSLDHPDNSDGLQGESEKRTLGEDRVPGWTGESNTLEDGMIDVIYSVRSKDRPYKYINGFGSESIVTTGDQFQARREPAKFWQPFIDDGILPEDGTWVKYIALDDEALAINAYRKNKKS